MAVVSFFTKPVPRHQLGGLTWSTINDPPMACGAIGEEGLVVTSDPERSRANGATPNSDGVAVQLLEVKNNQGNLTVTALYQFLQESMRSRLISDLDQSLVFFCSKFQPCHFFSR